MSDKLEIPGYENVVVHKSNIDTTNEQKAKELIGCNPYSCKSSDVNFCQKTYHNGLMCKEKARLIKAMEWKEKQMVARVKTFIKEIARICDITDENGYRVDERYLLAELEKALKGE